MRLRLALCALAAAACGLPDPCPKGLVRQDDGRCVSMADSSAILGDAAAEPDPEQDTAADSQEGADGGDIDLTGELDAALSADPGPDAQSNDAAPSAAAPDGGGGGAGQPGDEAGAPDEGAGAIDASARESDSGSAEGGLACRNEAVDAWRRFQISTSAVSTTLACYAADPRCASATCNIDACLKAAAGMEGCDTCIASETQCVAQYCATACSTSTDDDACRACACAARCFEAPSGCGTRQVDACADCRGASCGARLSARSETVTIPLFFHFVYDRIDAASGLPAYALNAANETMLDVDASLDKANGILDAAHSDARRLRLVRAGVVYIPASAAGACPDPVAVIDANRLFDAINVVLTPDAASCPSASLSAYAARANSRTLLREVAHTLGLWDTDRGNGAWATVEPLYRDRDPASAASCYRRGDFTCDTPPDYGYVGDNRCGSLIAGHDLCTQDNAYPFDMTAQPAPCDVQDAIVDATGVCAPLGVGGRRSYDPARLGLFADRPGNVMGSHTEAVLTPEQLLRMHNYVQWRLVAGSRVSAAEQRIRFGMNHGPSDPIWNRSSHRDYGLANAQVTASMTTGTFPVPTTFEYPGTAFDARGRVMGLRFSASLEGTPSDNLRVVITPSDPRDRIELPRGAIRVRDGVMWVDEAFMTSTGSSLFAGLRGYRSATKWTVQVQDSGPLSIRDPRFELVQSDRMPLPNDRHARGSSDILVYRPSTSRLYTAINPGTGSLAFGSPVSELIPALPDGLAKVTSGDVDGDGGVDLIARRGGTLWFALYAESYAKWNAGSIAGNDLPATSDEVLMCDLDGDGYGDLLQRRLDLTYNMSRWTFYRGAGDGSFDTAPKPDMGPGFDAPNHDLYHGTNIQWALGDVTGHGVCDMIARSSDSGMISFSNNLTPGPATSGVAIKFYGAWNPALNGSIYFGSSSDQLFIMDVNQDGVGDIVARRRDTAQWYTHLKQGDFYGPPQLITIGGRSTAFNDTDVVLGAVP